MQRWPLYLAEVPATLLRLIAATSRVSLPRRSTPAERLARVRRALCRPAAVRERYFTFAPAIQAAAQTLRTAPRWLTPAAVVAQFGPLRPLAELRRDRAPRSIAEQLLLAGWLLPRPARRNHPPGYVIPHEVRAWLPQPPPTPSHPPQPVATCTPLAVRAATAILITAASAPLPLRRDGQLTVAARRRLHPLLADLAAADADALTTWITPLLADLGLLAPHGAAAAAAPAAARFLAAPVDARLDTLRDAWVRAPRAEPALLPPRASQQGLDWPALRRRLLSWVEALRTEAATDLSAAFATLTAAFGPLADAHTHPFRTCVRPPWNQRTASAVWTRALRGPLAWLGSTSAPGADGQPPQGASGSDRAPRRSP